ncbi:MAG: flavin reductase family protein [Candidatus Latescibacteria bacterium]|nr:flavin reductase family protein [Candidatus Latescibacterota bacterium]
MAPPASPHDPALQLLPSPVVIVGAAAGPLRGGLTAAWVTRVSTAPPLLAVAVSPLRHTHGLLRDEGEFTVSVLREGQVEVARLFGLQSGRDLDKWERTPAVLLGGGVPALRDCAARLLCRLVARHPAGDHDLLVGEVLVSEVVGGGPALPMRGTDYAPRG